MFYLNLTIRFKTRLNMIIHGSVMVLEAAVLKKMYRRLIKSFLDVVILSELRGGSMSGYDVIAFVHSKHRLLVSSGTVYSLLYSLERDGLVEGRWNQRKRVYTLTDKGEKTIEAIMKANEKIKGFLVNILKC